MKAALLHGAAALGAALAIGAAPASALTRVEFAKKADAICVPGLVVPSQLVSQATTNAPASWSIRMASSTSASTA